jgi:WD40 repeat protein
MGHAWVWGTVGVFVLAFGLSTALAEAPKVGDKVEIKFGDSWVEATVTWIEGDRVRARSSTGLESWFKPGEFRAAGKTEAKPGDKPGTEAPADKPGVKPAVAPPALPRVGEMVEVSFAGTWLGAKVLKLDGTHVQAKLASGMEKWFEQGQYRVIPKLDPKFYAGLTPGSRVQAHDGHNWLSATVKKREAARFFIHYDDWSDAWDTWLTPEKIRPRPEAAAGQVATAGGAAPGAGGEVAATPGVIQTKSGSVVLGDLSTMKDLLSDEEVDWKVKSDAPAAPATGNGPFTVGTSFQQGEKVQRIQFAGTDAMIALLHDDPFEPSKTRVARVSLASNHPPEVVSLPMGERVMDFSPDGTQALCRLKSAEVPNCLEVTPLATAKPGREIVWKPHAPQKNDEGEMVMAAFVDERHVISCDSQGDLMLWELPGDKAATTQATTAPTATAAAARPKAIYRLKVSTDIKPMLAPGRKVLVAESKNALRFFDALTGAPLGTIRDHTFSSASIAFNPAGTLLAVTTAPRIYIIDMASGRTAREVPLPPEFVKKSSTATTWLPSGHLLLGRRYLVSPSRRLVLWSYLFPKGTQIESYAGNSWFVAGDNGPLSLCSVKLPHEEAKAAAPAVKVEDLMVFRKGDPVNIDLSTDAPGDTRAKIQASLEKQVKAMGLTPGGGTVRVLASTTTGETKNVEYRIFGRGVESVSVTEKIHALSVEVDGKEVWKVTNKTGASFMISAKQGQSLQDAVREQQDQSYAWLAGLKLPRDLVRTDGYKVQGTSKVTARGVEAATETDEAEDQAAVVRPARRNPR